MKLLVLGPVFCAAAAVAMGQSADGKQSAPVMVYPVPQAAALSEQNLYLNPPLQSTEVAKLEAIPTDWPNLKIEKIPTRWPGMKIVPVGDKAVTGAKLKK
jgi:hypothetical protein